MKLLLDQNLSHRLVGVLESSYGGSIHVRDIGLASASDDAVWSHARKNGFMIVTKDADFHQMSVSTPTGYQAVLLNFPALRPRFLCFTLFLTTARGVSRYRVSPPPQDSSPSPGLFSA